MILHWWGIFRIIYLETAASVSFSRPLKSLVINRRVVQRYRTTLHGTNNHGMSVYWYFLIVKRFVSQFRGNLVAVVDAIWLLLNIRHRIPDS